MSHEAVGAAACGRDVQVCLFFKTMKNIDLGAFYQQQVCNGAAVEEVQLSKWAAPLC